MARGILKSGWMNDLISPNEAINRNFYLSKELEKFCNHIVVQYSRKRLWDGKRDKKSGIWLEEDKVNDRGGDFHNIRYVNVEL